MAGKEKNNTNSVWPLALAIAMAVLLPARSRAQETVKLGDLAAISNAAIYIAIEHFQGAGRCHRHYQLRLGGETGSRIGGMS
jgi:hypothetical protein